MQTYSHYLLTAIADKKLKSGGLSVASKAFLIGSFMPDVPLVILSFGYIAYIYWVEPGGLTEDIFAAGYDNLYFNNPVWIASHNIFHAPLLITLITAIGYYAKENAKSIRYQTWGNALFWFALACGFHSVIDIFTHYDDGPVLFFPLNWTYRFTAPISYWDVAHGARIFAPLEHLLDLGIIIYLVWGWLSKKQQQRKNKETT